MNYEEILNQLNKDCYIGYTLFQDPDTKKLVVQCHYLDAFDNMYGEPEEFYDYNEYEYDYSADLENYLLKNLKNAY